jgi:hypothetical protein
MDQTAETIPTDDLTEARKIHVVVVWRIWNAEFQAAMRSCLVVMVNVGPKHLWGSKTLIWKLRVIQRSSVFELVVLEG